MFKLDRCNLNPILKPNPNNDWEDLCVLNPAAIWSDELNKFVLVYRAAGHDREHRIRLGLAYSDDGIHFDRVLDKPCFEYSDEYMDGGCIEDPRLVKIDDCYFMTYASRAFFPGKYWMTREELLKEEDELGMLDYPLKPEAAPVFIRTNQTVSYLAYTYDFKKWKRLGRITDCRYDDRDVIIFPERINGKFVKISRPKRDDKKPAMWITYSDDILEWGEPTIFYRGEEWWEKERIGVGCPPIKTKDGWLLIYHGVDSEKEIYRVGMMLLDLDNPSKILAKTKDFIMEPSEDYETCGIYNGCVFPTGVVLKDGLLYIYYGTADKFVGLATKKLDDCLEYLNSLRK